MHFTEIMEHENGINVKKLRKIKGTPKEMWSPTHVHVIVQRAENLLIKGKDGTNNSFIVIELGKEIYRTSIKEKSGPFVIWNEECELKIPKIANAAAIILTAHHRNSLGLDQFIGTVRIPLASFDIYQKSIQWYRLQGKPGKEKGKCKVRGELEVEICFISRSQSLSLTSLESKKKNSLSKLTGSLFSLRHSDKKVNVKKFTNTLVRNVFKKKEKDIASMENLGQVESNPFKNPSSVNNCNNLDPGVVSDEEDSGSHKSTESLAYSNESSKTPKNPTVTPPIKPRRIFLENPEISVSQWEDNDSKLICSLNVSADSMTSNGSRRHKPKLEDLRGRLSDRRLSISCVDFSHLSSPKPEKKFSSSLQLEKNQGDSHKRLSKLTKKLKSFHSDKKEAKRIASETEWGVALENAVPKSEFKNKNKDELINMVVDLQKRVNCISVRVKDLEDYLDDILLKVMETVPKILEKS